MSEKFGNKELKHKYKIEEIKHEIRRDYKGRRFALVENLPGSYAEMTYRNLLDLSTQLKDIALLELGPLLAADELDKTRHWPELENPLKNALRVFEEVEDDRLFSYDLEGAYEEIVEARDEALEALYEAFDTSTDRLFRHKYNLIIEDLDDAYKKTHETLRDIFDEYS